MYYSPELCRFISPDDIEYLDPKSVNGLNLYCYCLNNPIIYVDPTGHFALSTVIIGALIWIAVCGLINGTVNVMTKMPEESVRGALVGGFFEGVVFAAVLAIGTFTGVAGWVILGGIVAVTGGFIGGKYGNAISQKISYGNVDWGVENLNGGFAALTNLVSYTGLYMNKDILSTSDKLGIRFFKNVGLSVVGLGMTAYIASLPKPNLNKFRDEERIKSQRGRFIWDYWF